MTITLVPEVETWLCERAARDGKDTEAVVNELLAAALADKAEKEEAYHRALLESGLVKQIARRTEPDTSDRRLIEVQGEPVSETIIREREAPASEEEKEAAFHQAMLAAGLLTSIPPPRDPSKAARPIFEVKGEPLSETIMRERR